MLSAFDLPNRPRTQLSLTLRDSKGQTLRPSRRRSPPVVLGARPEDLVRLDCGMIIGAYVHITQFGWDRLTPGRYHATLALSSRTASFVKSKSGYFEALMRVRGDSRTHLETTLSDFDLVTTFTFDVPRR